MKLLSRAMIFVYGIVLGAFSTVLYLQFTGQLSGAAEMAPRGRPADPAPAAVRGPDPGSTGSPEPNRAQPWLAVPVADVAVSALRDTWGASRGTRKHEAIDIAAPSGTAVIAVADGKIMKLYRSKAGGITIYEASADEQWIYYYAHLDRYRLGLKEGMTIARGEVIGYVGTSGNAPVKAPHLHFSIERMPPGGEWWKGEAINPYPILKRRGRAVSADGLPPADSVLKDA